MAKKTFVCLSRNFAKKGDDFAFHIIKAKSADTAWQKVEGSIATTNSQDWLMTPNDFCALKRLIDNCVNIFKKGQISAQNI